MTTKTLMLEAPIDLCVDGSGLSRFLDENDCRIIDPAQGVPDGWKLVPVEPTMEMIDDGHHQIDFDRSDQNTLELNHESQITPLGAGTTIEQDMRDCWAAMLAAAPSPAAVEKEQ